ncbi:neutral and basic amino acid transport protein rBAT [Huso huso]|uniref:Neutral and basic amino acid transport protein rBAT n=1 Tax=Huso huso TaxID=61971 RepID=A0ABR0ZWT2_HUSHU
MSTARSQGDTGSWRLKPTTMKYINVINMLLLMLPGMPTSYYGEEIGMENTAVSEDHIQDPFGKFDPVSVR